MKAQGVRVLDPVTETVQLEWRVVPTSHCRDAEAEEYLVVRYFRKPRRPAGADRAYVEPVEIRRTRTRVLFRQQLGVLL